MQSSEIKPCPLRPLSLGGLSSETEGAPDAARDFNRMLALANSPVIGYFYGMPQAFNALEDALGCDPFTLQDLSFGEAAACVARLCQDEELVEVDLIMPHFGPGLDLTSRARTAVRAFMRPLLHLALRYDEVEDTIPYSQWKPVEKMPELFLGGSLSLRQCKQRLDCFGPQGPAKAHKCPEERIKRVFAFNMEAYREMAAALCDDAPLLERTLRPFTSSWKDVFGIISKMEHAIQDHLAEQADACEMDRTSSLPERVEQAYEGMYLLFIRPFAALYTGYAPAIAYRNTLAP